jgi:hypothetical protein
MRSRPILTVMLLTLLLSVTAGQPVSSRGPSGPAPSPRSGQPRPVQLPWDPHEIPLASAVIDVRGAASRNQLGVQHRSTAERYYLVHFAESPSRDSAAQLLQAVPLENILHPIEPNTYLCRLGPSQLEALETIEEIDWVGLWEPSYKISPTVYGDAEAADEFVVTLFAGEDAAAYAARIAALGAVVHSTTRDRLHVHVEESGIAQIAALPGVYWIERRYPVLPANDDTTWIVQTNQPDNRSAFDNGLTGSGQVIGVADSGVDADHLMFWDSAQGLPNHTYNAAQRKILAYYNWYQTGTLTGTIPSRYYDPGDGYYPSAADPMFGVYDWDIESPSGSNARSGHGTHTAGSAAGEWVTGVTLPTWGTAPTAGYDFYEGNAFGARLVVQDVGRGDSPYLYLPPDLNDPTPAGTLNGVPYPGSVGLFPQALADGAYIHLNPWNSAGGAGTYTAYAQDVDEMVWANSGFLPIFPAGDGGSGTAILPPATAKNGLTVGASGTSDDGYGHSAEDVASFSSWGPVGGWGRTKPDVCAPGQVVLSAQNDDLTSGADPNDGLAQLQGTSMAAAAAAGAAALARQYYTAGRYTPVAMSTGFSGGGALTPSAALLKATLINSAQPMTGTNTGGTIPGDGQGWGRMLLDNALYFAGETRSLLVDDNTAGVDGAAIVQPFFKAYTLYVAPGQPLEIVVTYSDPPGTAGSAFQMVNYLYVELDHPNGITYWLSGRGNYSNGQPVPNTAFIYPDTVQTIRINDPDPGVYTLYVVAFQTDQVTPGWNVQPYALAVSGNLVQSQGYVQFDKGFYQTTDTLILTLADGDLAGTSTAGVTLTSAATGDTETITLNETGGYSGAFQKTVAAAPGAADAGDGTLQVSDPDTLTVTYNDANPAGTRTATARIDMTPPVTLDPAATPSDVRLTAMFTLTATVDDASTGSTDITAAEYFVDAVGADGAGTSMAAADGSFSSPVENVVANVTAVAENGLSPGTHTLYVHGRDTVGLWGAASPVTVNVRPWMCYVPLAMRNAAIAPDLVVERVVATPSQVQVVIRNQGSAAVPDDEAHEFWVDVYVDPDHPPVYNETCQTMGCQGAAWGITWSGSPFSPADPARRALPLEPGEVFTLTTGGDYYWPLFDSVEWPLAPGTPVYAQVDSASAATSYGVILENHEITGGAYNNVFGPALTTPSAELRWAP